jgi:hypothetical protein
MDRADAEQTAARLGKEHPDRATHRWIARAGSGGGGWEVVKVKMPPGMRVDPLKATVQSKPKPEQPEDPRPPGVQNIPPYGPGF